MNKIKWKSLVCEYIVIPQKHFWGCVDADIIFKNHTDSLIDKALWPSDEEHLLRSVKGVMFKNWFLSQEARSSSKAFFYEIQKDFFFLIKTITQLKYAE